jgi:hypothetical protein
MTRTAAAEAIALHLRVSYRQNGGDLTVMRAEELVSELRAGHRGEYLQEVARLAHPKTVLRLAVAGL